MCQIMLSVGPCITLLLLPPLLKKAESAIMGEREEADEEAELCTPMNSSDCG